ncbi:MAG: SDR family NAD(P)-dependent oxidoreductase [Deltaproteobacteria bacterium]|nr:SDR family NAD(P)-dependent oxidoreductase [Deltaproteobacteria bacterium]
MKMSECVAIVTGGASGLGEAVVRNFVAKGGKAAILDVQEERGNRLAAELGASAVFARTDVTSEESVAAAIEKTIGAFGRLNVVVNCAGIVTPGKVVGKNGPMPLAAYEGVIRVNLVGSFNVLRLAAEKMAQNEPNEEGERGVVVSTASVAAYEGQIGQAAYSSSKAGIVGLTLPAARELADLGIRVMAIAPGLFETPMFDALPEKAREALAQMTPFPRRLGRPAEFAKLVEAIVEIPMLNGSTIRLDGAIRMREK